MKTQHQVTGEEGQTGKDDGSTHPPMPFLEVTCRSSGKVRRFAAGTTARYALHAINRKLKAGGPAALHIEAVSEGEEPVSFGPAAPLADYGHHWKLQTITEQDFQDLPITPKQEQEQAVKKPLDRNTRTSTSIYIAKIVLAFMFIFLLGGLFTYLLEKLPEIFDDTWLLFL